MVPTLHVSQSGRAFRTTRIAAIILAREANTGPVTTGRTHLVAHQIIGRNPDFKTRVVMRRA